MTVDLVQEQIEAVRVTAEIKTLGARPTPLPVTLHRILEADGSRLSL